MTGAGFLAVLALVALALAFVMSGAWLAWRATRNAGWIDATWTFGLGAIGVAASLAAGVWTPALPARQLLVAALIALWALRLGAHIVMRTRTRADDPRYARLAAEYGDDAVVQMFRLCQKQALVSIPLALAMALAAANPAPTLRLADALGAAILAIAIAGEALSDAQLRRFSADPRNRGKICDVGLWGWSRHPNYFFEWLGWLAYPVIAIDWTGARPWGFVALAGPACMYWLLRYVTGVPPLEEHMAARRGAAFAAYQARVSAFFPAPPRNPA